jgi:hypothetical protein
MRGLIASAAALLWLLPVYTDVRAQEARILLTPEQTKVYHECLTEGWIEDFCRSHSWGVFSSYDRTYAACIAAEHRGRSLVNGRPPIISMEAYCWEQAHRFLR